ncbi:hypothetical protein PJF56_10000 [Roseofilum sp. BLCC_M91]|uniref:Uncharacterized protein n=1 Tax=Roseofilum halophilum BLCC-M91 TaxID=3022259 RepID=A0ABT7BK90_9CYAN|nr:hypothetical protein [Roseofilum halophilum]MDJ1179197.1 hypothetical protein [Roseofilum halophilum BLCC-M91]
MSETVYIGEKDTPAGRDRGMPDDRASQEIWACLPWKRCRENCKER